MDGGPGLLQGPGRGDDVLPSLAPDLEKRQNPVCHFVTPLDGSVEVDEHRRPEVLGCRPRVARKGPRRQSLGRRQLTEGWQ